MTARMTSTRKPRADAQRNRERLIDAAKAAFSDLGADASLEEIARRAEVGIGTLYRHFPSRDAMVEAVYRREVEQLATAAERLVADLPAGEALHQWLRLFVDYLATKKLIAPALGTLSGGTTQLFERSGVVFRQTLALLVESGVSAGEIRADVEAADLMQAMAGLSYGVGAPGWEARTLRLVDILMDGLRQAPRV